MSKAMGKLATTRPDALFDRIVSILEQRAATSSAPSTPAW